MALEQRLLNQSRESGVGLDRQRRRVVFQRVVARLHIAQPGRWVLKGGMALEVRLRDAARLTKDVDLGLRDNIAGADELHDRLSEALTADPFSDRFALAVGPFAQLVEDEAGDVTWRAKVTAHLAGRPFGAVQVDISPRAYELEHTDVVALPNALDFAGIDAPSIEIIDVHRHAAEKLHAMFKDFGERENTRVRDLVDFVILCEHDLLDVAALAAALRQVWHERDGTELPDTPPPLPANWSERYEQLAAEHRLITTSFAAALVVVRARWAGVSITEEA